MWDCFSFPETRNHEKKWDLFLNQSSLPIHYVKRHINSLNKVSKSYEYVVQNLAWSGLYLRSTLLYDLLQEVLILVLVTATGHEVYVATTTAGISNYYDDMEEALNHLKILKFKIFPGENVIYLCDTILFLYIYLSLCVCVFVCVCVCVCVWVGGCVYVFERERVCVCVCVTSVWLYK